jgi:hypothetical protein
VMKVLVNSVPIEGLTVTILAEDREIVELILEKVVNEDGQTAIADLTEAIIDFHHCGVSAT